MSFINLLLLVIVVGVFFKCSAFNQIDDDKLGLKPRERVELISKDLLNSDVPDPESRQSLVKTSTIVTISSITGKHPSPVEKRKVWSRWSKWGECNVSCGLGFIHRKRVCVAGRCAPGEMEEQRRLCNRSPCSPTTDHYDEMIE